MDVQEHNAASAEEHTYPAGPCPCCHRDNWWLKPCGRQPGQWTCGTCHPNPAREAAQPAPAPADGAHQRLRRLEAAVRDARTYEDLEAVLEQAQVAHGAGQLPAAAVEQLRALVSQEALFLPDQPVEPVEPAPAGELEPAPRRVGADRCPHCLRPDMEPVSPLRRRCRSCGLEESRLPQPQGMAA